MSRGFISIALALAMSAPAMADTVPTDSDGGPVAAIPAHNATEACNGDHDCIADEGGAIYRLMFKMDWGSIPARYRRDCIASAGNGKSALFLRSIESCIVAREKAGN